MSLNLDTKRWMVIVAGVLANLCQGAAYSFSVFKGPLKDRLGCSETEVALTFSISVALLPVGMLASGKLADRRSPGLVVAAGGLVFGLGMFLAAYAHSLAALYLTLGAMLSIGNGAAYGAVVSASVKWFPDRRGMASGMVVGALGIGTVIMAPLAQRMIDSPALGLSGAFKVLGAAFIVITLIASRFVSNPPPGYAPAGFVPRVDPTTRPQEELPWTRMIAKARFWVLYTMYLTGAFSGLMLASQASSIAQEVSGLSAAAGSLIVSVFGLANATGRMFWGAVSDRIGRFEALSLMFAVTAAVMFSFGSMAAGAAGLTLAVLLVALCYGGYLGVFPSVCADTFGSANLTVNYGIMFSGFSLAGVLGPRVGAALRESSGSYGSSFTAAGIVAAAGLLIVLVARSGDRRDAPRR